MALTAKYPTSRGTFPAEYSSSDSGLLASVVLVEDDICTWDCVFEQIFNLHDHISSLKWPWGIELIYPFGAWLW